jgi:hypothetical protein
VHTLEFGSAELSEKAGTSLARELEHLMVNRDFKCICLLSYGNWVKGRVTGYFEIVPTPWDFVMVTEFSNCKLLPKVTFIP